uniref:ATP synthase complex subunit 8 n=1 Tax=Gekko subpalmatus TaxID=515999 RepID=A0A7G9UAP6_9SAUR|nr:ATP synthase F0 subunit 8 [Gekko subpalmatus]QNN90177.1 ATP synthase F0 subunit 8 [Gekko subpalmatus]
MPQLNPAPWLLIFTVTWIAALTLFKLMTALQNPASPIKYTHTHTSDHWTWTWL